MAEIERRNSDSPGRRTKDAGPQQMLIAQQQEIIHSSMFSGPVPPPEVLAEYAKIHPSLVDRIFAMTESQSAHRKNLETQSLLLHSEAVARSTYAGLSVAIVGLGVAAFLGFLGHPTAAAIVGGADLVGLVSVFITGRRPPAKSEVPAKQPLR
jgi:uncharacterized membrane protein